jgi:hypothetical protein
LPSWSEDFVSVIEDLKLILSTDPGYIKLCIDVHAKQIHTRIPEALRDEFNDDGTLSTLLNVAAILLPLLPNECFFQIEDVPGLFSAFFDAVFVLASRSFDVAALRKIFAQCFRISFIRTPYRTSSLFRGQKYFSAIAQTIARIAALKSSESVSYIQALTISIGDFLEKSPKNLILCQQSGILLELVKCLRGCNDRQLCDSVLRLMDEVCSLEYIKTSPVVPELRELCSILDAGLGLDCTKPVLIFFLLILTSYSEYAAKLAACNLRQSVVKNIVEFQQVAASEDAKADDSKDAEMTRKDAVVSCFELLIPIVGNSVVEYESLNLPEFQQAQVFFLERGIAVMHIISLVRNLFSILKSTAKSPKISQRIAPFCEQQILSFVNVLHREVASLPTRRNCINFLSELCADYIHVRQLLCNRQGYDLVLSLIRFLQVKKTSSQEEQLSKLDILWSSLKLCRNYFFRNPNLRQEFKSSCLSSDLYEALLESSLDPSNPEINALICCWSLCFAFDAFPEVMMLEPLLTRIPEMDSKEMDIIQFEANSTVVNPEALKLYLSILPHCSKAFQVYGIKYLNRVGRESVLNLQEYSSIGLLSCILKTFKSYFISSTGDADLRAEIFVLFRELAQFRTTSEDVYLLIDCLEQADDVSYSALLSSFKELLTASEAFEDSETSFIAFDSRYPGIKKIQVPFSEKIQFPPAKGFSLAFWASFDVPECNRSERIITILKEEEPIFELAVINNTLRARWKWGKELEEVYFRKFKIKPKTWHHIAIIQSKNWTFQNQLRLFVDGAFVELQGYAAFPPFPKIACYLGESGSSPKVPVRNWRLASIYLSEGVLSDAQVGALFFEGKKFILRRIVPKSYKSKLSTLSYEEQSLAVLEAVRSVAGLGKLSRHGEDFKISPDQVIFFYHADSFFKDYTQHLSRLRQFYDEKADDMVGDSVLLYNDFCTSNKSLSSTQDAAVSGGCRVVKWHGFASSVYDGCAMNSFIPLLSRCTKTEGLNSLLWIVAFVMGRSSVNLMRMHYFRNFHLLSYILRDKVQLWDGFTVDIIGNLVGLHEQGTQGVIINAHALDALLLQLAIWKDLPAVFRCKLLQVISNSVRANVSKDKNLHVFKSLRRKTVQWSIAVVFLQEPKDVPVPSDIIQSRVQLGVGILETMMYHGHFKKHGLRNILDFLIGSLLEKNECGNSELLAEFQQSQSDQLGKAYLCMVDISWTGGQENQYIRKCVLQLLLRLVRFSSPMDLVKIPVFQYFDMGFRNLTWKWLVELLDYKLLYTALQYPALFEVDEFGSDACVLVRMYYQIFHLEKARADAFRIEDGFMRLKMLLLPNKHSQSLHSILVLAFLGVLQEVEEPVQLKSLGNYVKQLLSKKGGLEIVQDLISRNLDSLKRTISVSIFQWTISFPEFAELSFFLLKHLVASDFSQESLSVIVQVVEIYKVMLGLSDSICTAAAASKIVIDLSAMLFSENFQSTLSDLDEFGTEDRKDPEDGTHFDIIVVKNLVDLIAMMVTNRIKYSSGGIGFFEDVLGLVPESANARASRIYQTMLILKITDSLATSVLAVKLEDLKRTEHFVSNILQLSDILLSTVVRNASAHQSSYVKVLTAFLILLQRKELLTPVGFKRVSDCLFRSVISLLIRTTDSKALEFVYEFIASNAERMFSKSHAETVHVSVVVTLLFKQLITPDLLPLRFNISLALSMVARADQETIRSVLLFSDDDGSVINIFQDGVVFLLSNDIFRFLEWVDRSFSTIAKLVLRYSDLLENITSQNEKQSFEFFSKVHDKTMAFVEQSSTSKELAEYSLKVLGDMKDRELIQRRSNQLDFAFCLQRDLFEDFHEMEQTLNFARCRIHDSKIIQDCRLNAKRFVETPFLCGTRWRLDSRENFAFSPRKKLYRCVEWNDADDDDQRGRRRFTLKTVMRDFATSEEEVKALASRRNSQFRDKTSELVWELPAYYISRRNRLHGFEHPSTEDEAKISQFRNFFNKISSPLLEEKKTMTMGDIAVSLNVWLKLMIDPDEDILHVMYCSRLVLSEERKAALVLCEDAFYMIEASTIFQNEMEKELSQLSSSEIIMKNMRTMFEYEDVRCIYVFRYIHQERGLQIIFSDGFYVCFVFQTVEQAKLVLDFFNAYWLVFVFLLIY